MLDIIKKGMLAGIGAAVITKESAEKVLSELVERGKLSSAEAKETAEKIATQGRKEYENAYEALQEAFDKMLRKAHVATQAELTALAERVAHLEQRAGVVPVAGHETHAATDASGLQADAE